MVIDCSALQSVKQADVVNIFADTQSGATAINTEAYQTQALSFGNNIIALDMFIIYRSDVLKLVDDFFLGSYAQSYI
jgi:hypothetical protein